MIDINTMLKTAKDCGMKFVPAQFTGVLEAEISEFELDAYTKAVTQIAVAAEREACARINAEKSNRLAQEAEQAIEEGDHDTCTSNRAAAHLLSVCAARIRARGTGGEG